MGQVETATSMTVLNRFNMAVAPPAPDSSQEVSASPKQAIRVVVETLPGFVPGPKSTTDVGQSRQSPTPRSRARRVELQNTVTGRGERI
jgi:hypothetical protein